MLTWIDATALGVTIIEAVLDGTEVAELARTLEASDLEPGVQALVMEVVEPPLIQVTRGLHTSESAVNEPGDEVVRLLSVCYAGEAAVLPLEKHTGVRHDGREEAGLALSEP